MSKGMHVDHVQVVEGESFGQEFAMATDRQLIRFRKFSIETSFYTRSSSSEDITLLGQTSFALL